MNVICLCQDDALAEKILQIFGKDSLKIVTDYQLIKKGELSSCDVLVVDLKDCLLPNSDFFSPILALTQVPLLEEAVAILKCGAKGYGNRHMRPSNLQQAIESVQRGQIWLPPSIVVSLIDKIDIKEELVAPKEPILSVLSKREQEVARFVAQGMSNQKIADKLFVSLRTVKAHLTSIFSKTGLRSRLELGIRMKGEVNSNRDKLH